MRGDDQTSDGRRSSFTSWNILSSMDMSYIVFKNYVRIMDYTHFRFELAQLLIAILGADSVRSAEYTKQDRLNVAPGHWPQYLKVRRDCVVCSKYRHVHHIPLAQGHHGSSVRCSYSKVHLCVHNAVLLKVPYSCGILAVVSFTLTVCLPLSFHSTCGTVFIFTSVLQS